VPEGDTAPTHAGGVVVRSRDARVWFLLVSARRQPDQLVLPKGHIEPGESVENAACREVLEEAGVIARIVDRLGTIHYGPARIGVCAQFFLMEFVSEGASSEGRRRAWLSLDEAVAAIPFDDTKQLLRDAHDVWARRARGDERT
jgi:8-oxo-dGTP pyrophosphatase MutT (NUDIX family)